ncbi:H-X9-DG-CTERM domain-containing protein [Roseimaritima ulvae]|uniref:Zinc-finger domain-containing protein n=1 Tax=Roseimaritima ulvae TaxID=980254 RepID=A0A5B9R7L1_9BACT|nr:H-X9-DG-CTERM domain-containing protein [Roseimaritima ulvae]QEG42691.1 hypothetical protein UC8_47330 [Roseimaritima ulvae]
MQPDLLGYLLGALEPHEMEQVEAALRESAELRSELEHLRQTLEPLDEAPPPRFEPPADLISRTLQRIDAHDPGHPPAGDAADSDDSGSGDSGSDSDSDVAESVRPAMQAAVLAAPGGRFRWSDVLASGIAATVLIGIALPSILHSRYEARKAACQDNLRRVGVAVTSFALSDPQQRLPSLSAEGPEAFAGVYSVRLGDAGLLDSLQSLWCPSLDRPASAPRQIPTVVDLHTAPPNRLAELQRVSGGSYGYTLGVMDGTEYRSPRYEARSTFAILGDVPVNRLAARGDDPASVASSHDARGVNLLFEDGHVRFLPIDATLQTRDHPFLNHHGRVEAGVNADDATLAPSWQSPFLDTRQR